MSNVSKITADSTGAITGLTAGATYAVVEFPAGCQIEEQPAAHMGNNKVRTVVTLVLIQDKGDVATKAATPKPASNKPSAVAAAKAAQTAAPATPETTGDTAEITPN